MRYLITSVTISPFITKWFDRENDFRADLGMIVYDLIDMKYTTDGENWQKIEFDHL